MVNGRCKAKHFHLPLTSLNYSSLLCSLGVVGIPREPTGVVASFRNLGAVNSPRDGTSCISW